ncbi:MAG TPA: HAMP domain-containing protein, partial [Candidatus Methanoperedenaceae archaeon]|nr:HAMP domain-containing protein [Candidatus Methanoperedenaceae archaeon]
MIVFLAVSLIPLLLTVYVAYTMSENSLLDSIRSHVYSVTESRAGTIDVWMGERKNDVTVLADSPVIRGLEKNSSYAYLTEVDRRYGGIYEELFLMDGRGDVISSTLNRTGNKKQGLIFIEPMAGTPYFSGVYFSETTGGPAITISVPVEKDGKIAGVLAARVNMTRLYGMMESGGTSEEAYIVNDAGMIISHTNRSKVLRDNINYSYAVKQVLAGNSGVGEYTGYNRNTVLGSYMWMPDYQWGLIAEYDRDKALAGIYALRRLTLVLTAFSLAVVLLSSFLFSRQITIPIHNLEGGAHALTRGEYKEIPVISDDEIGRLTRIFNATSRELLDAKRKLEIAVELVNRDLEIRNEELRRANVELKKLDSMKSDFISMVSHELKTPLSAIRTSAEVLEGETDPSVRREMQGIIIRNIDRQTRLINDILDMSKIESGKIELVI